MKHLPIRTPLYQRYLISFTEWLNTLGYCESNCKGFPNRLREFFHHLEAKNVTQLTDITHAHIQDYIEHIKTKKSCRGEGALSIPYINNHIQVIKMFSAYLKPTSGIALPHPPDYIKERAVQQRNVLTREEIQQLYNHTDESLYGIRDRAILTLYYGCGLRKEEGINLNTDNVLTERRLIHITKAKNRHKRYVPLTENGLRYLENYIRNARPLLLADESNETALLLSMHGERIGKNSIYNRIKLLYKEAGITKKADIHTLRHSIATHLLQKGMTLEQIALFLGHRSLDSTQLYTHIINQLGNETISQ